MRSLPTLEQELIFISSNQITAPNSGKGAKGIKIETHIYIGIWGVSQLWNRS